MIKFNNKSLTGMRYGYNNLKKSLFYFEEQFFGIVF